MQAFASLQVVPFGLAGAAPQAPVVGSQVPAVWHWSGAVQVIAVPAQVPAVQTSVCVHRLPSLQAVPFARLVPPPQTPVLLQVSPVLQRLPVLQAERLPAFLPPVQAPLWQVCPVWQGVAQAVPLATPTHWQASPRPSLLVSSWLALATVGQLSRQSLTPSWSPSLASRRNGIATRAVFEAMSGMNAVRSTPFAWVWLATTWMSATAMSCPESWSLSRYFWPLVTFPAAQTTP